jgi:hypothetical protein
MSRDLKALVAEGAIATAHRELAQALAALETERRLPNYLLLSLKRIELMLHSDTIEALADRLRVRIERGEARPCL